MKLLTDSPTTKIVTYRSNFIHNGHSIQRDKLLIEIYGEQWLREQKAKGMYGGDWPEEMLGQPKPDVSGYLDENGDMRTVGEVVYLEDTTKVTEVD